MRPSSPLAAIVRRQQLWCAVTLCAWQLWLLARFYRLFIYDERGGRVWGVADDVYISAAFGRTLAAGQGFVWYPGAPRVEGVTNPLWSLWIGALHWLPGIRDTNIGLAIVLCNAVLLGCTAVLFCTALGRCTFEHADPGPEPTAWWPSIGLLVCVPGFSLPYWSAEGFEVALIAALALGALVLALATESTRRTLTIGALFGIGLMTRMDFVWVSIPAALVVLARPAPRARRLLLVVGPASALALGALLARRSYFGDWLPNTYYLKATGWPWAQRWHAGVQQNVALLQAAAVVWLPWLVPAVRQQLRGRASAVLGCWLAFALTVLYSTELGGDSWKLRLGYDRHTVVGGVLLLWGLAAMVASCSARWPWRVGLLLWALAVAAWPVVRAPRIAAELRDYVLSDHPRRRENERKWIRYGRTFETISNPGARVALCPAGAIVYFSHRGGVDLLGKLDPYVAHLPVSPGRSANRRCWQNAPGHNKEDDLGVFARSKPEFSRYPPPAQFTAAYVRARAGGETYFVLRGTPLARWDALNP